MMRHRTSLYCFPLSESVMIVCFAVPEPSDAPDIDSGASFFSPVPAFSLSEALGAIAAGLSSETTPPALLTASLSALLHRSLEICSRNALLALQLSRGVTSSSTVSPIFPDVLLCHFKSSACRLRMNSTHRNRPGHTVGNADICKCFLIL